MPAHLGEGNSVVLTIDRTIQHITQKALEASVTEYGAQSGMAIVMAPASGEVLALAHYPFFNPNRYSDFGREVWRNRAITDPFEPGSTMKMFSAAAAIDSGACSSSTIFYCENGEYRIGRNIVHDTKSHGWLSLQQIVKYSSNIGAVKMAEKLGAHQLFDYLTAFGFGQRSGIALSGRNRRQPEFFQYLVRHRYRCHLLWPGGVGVGYPTDHGGIGHCQRRPLLMKPLLVRAVNDRNGKTITTFSPEPVRRVISAQTAATIRRILKTVISEGGTGVNAALQGYSACGKTGTAQKIDKKWHLRQGKIPLLLPGICPGGPAGTGHPGDRGRT